VAGLSYKHNDRAYESSGVELSFAADLDAHQLNVGMRSHEDEMDRLQPVEVYDQVNGQLVFAEFTPPSGGNNRLEGADAFSFWIADNWQLSDVLGINLVLRYEDVDSWRRQFGATRGELTSTRGNTSSEWLPGVSFTYDVNDDWQLLAGVHRGFSPLGGGAQSHEEPEISVNYEAGARFGREAFFAEAIGFYSDFSNKTQNCSVANPCPNGAESGSFSNGEAVVQGLEVQVGTLLNAGNFQLPLQFAYTYTDAEVTDAESILGVRRGDRLADIPEQLFSLRAGLEHNSGWNTYAVAKYTDELCVSVGCNRDGTRYDRTESLLVVDAVSHYAFNPSATAFLKVENLFDEQAIVSRAPDGARPNKPRTASVGVRFDF
jgi:Fe(3+) dicitrate transport protein